MVHCVFQCWALIAGVETFSLKKLTISINTQSTWRLSSGKSRLSNVQYLEFKLVNERHKRSHTTTAHAFFLCIHHSNWQRRKAYPPLFFFLFFSLIFWHLSFTFVSFLATWGEPTYFFKKGFEIGALSFTLHYKK